MTRNRTQGQISGPLMAAAIGVLGGLALLTLVHFGFSLGGPKVDRSGRLAILINGMSERMARDVLLPNYGWVLQVRLPDAMGAAAHEDFTVELRSERTGATIQIEDQFSDRDGIATLMIPKSLGLATGLLSVRVSYLDATGRRFEDSRRIRIRSWFGGKPIGNRQVILFDFEVDRNEDDIPDFLADLARFGLASRDQRPIADKIAARIKERAILRVEQAFDPSHDPNQTGKPRDAVHVRFRPTSNPGALVTRICVGGSDPTESDSVGHVRFDLRNEDKDSRECGDEPVSGLFPAELEIYQDAELYREVFSPFLASLGGTPIGRHPDDAKLVLGEIAGKTDAFSSPARRAKLDRVIAVFGDVLGSVMAHEAGHALGLVAEGQPGVGLFGGSEGDAYAHNLNARGEPTGEQWLMNPGRSFSFEELAGESDEGPLQFRPLNYAYLRDRVVVSDKR